MKINKKDFIAEILDISQNINNTINDEEEFVSINLRVEITPVDLMHNDKTLIERMWEEESNFFGIEGVLDNLYHSLYLELINKCSGDIHTIRNCIKHAVNISHTPYFEYYDAPEYFEINSVTLIIPCDISLDYIRRYPTIENLQKS